MKTPKIETPEEDPEEAARRQQAEERAETDRIDEKKGTAQRATAALLRRFGRPSQASSSGVPYGNFAGLSNFTFGGLGGLGTSGAPTASPGTRPVNPFVQSGSRQNTSLVSR